MDIYRLADDTRFTEQIGSTLETSERYLACEDRLKLELGLVRLTELANADQLLFWGRVDTTTKPYYIALSLDLKGHFEFPHKRFFWSTNSFQFAELPALLSEYKDKVSSFNHLPLTGNPKHILVNVTGAEGEVKEQKKEVPPAEVDSDEEAVVKPEPKNFTELDRLAFVVRAIESDCQVVPVGAFRLNEQHELRYNDKFCGLSKGEAVNPINYQLFRSPQSKDKQAQISRPESIFEFDFLDGIAGSKNWSVQADASGKEVTLRNLEWQGYVGYHRAETPIFGGVYLGDGCKRVDIPFYL